MVVMAPPTEKLDPRAAFRAATAAAFSGIETVVPAVPLIEAASVFDPNGVPAPRSRKIVTPALSPAGRPASRAAAVADTSKRLNVSLACGLWYPRFGGVPGLNSRNSADTIGGV